MLRPLREEWQKENIKNKKKQKTKNKATPGLENRNIADELTRAGGDGS